MPPKVKITRDDIINAATVIVRTQGESTLNARGIAAVLGCSTQPVFSNFKSMDEVRSEIIIKAEEIYDEFNKNEIAKSEFPPYKAAAMAYIRFAKVENNLFKLLFLSGRSNAEFENCLEALATETTGLSGDTARLFNLEMWAFVNGLAVMTANDRFPLHDSVLSEMLTDAFEGLKIRFNI